MLLGSDLSTLRLDKFMLCFNYNQRDCKAKVEAYAIVGKRSDAKSRFGSLVYFLKPLLMLFLLYTFGVALFTVLPFVAIS